MNEAILLKKYIFPVCVLAFVIAITQAITHFTQNPAPEKEAAIIEGWKYITADNFGNSYYIDINSITEDKKEDSNVRFHAIYRKVYSDKGREGLAASYSESGIDISQMSNIDHEIQTIYFGDINGDKFVTKADCKFYKSDGSEIPSLEMNVTVDETTMQPIPGKSMVEVLYDYAFTRLPKDE